MQREFVSMNDEWNVGDAIDFLRKNKSDPCQKIFMKFIF